MAELPSLTTNSSDEEILFVLRQGASVAHAVVSTITDWSFSRGVNGQYNADISINNAVVGALNGFGCGVLSEESGASGFSATRYQDLGNQIVIVVDPLDGSTNASRGVPWFATALCAVDAKGPRVGLVANLAAPHTEYAAIRGKGAWRNGMPFTCTPRDGSTERSLRECVVGISGPPPKDPGWWQFRAFGAAALDLCLVAEGALDAYLDCDTHGVWDYLASLLICREAGVEMVDAYGLDLVTLLHSDRRSPIAARQHEIVEKLRDLRASIG